MSIDLVLEEQNPGPAGQVDLQFGATGQTLPGRPLVLQFKADATNPQGQVNLTFGLEGEATLPPLDAVITATAPAPVAFAAARVGTRAVIVGTLPAPVAMVAAAYDVNVWRGPGLMVGAPYGNAAARSHKELEETWSQASKASPDKPATWQEAARQGRTITEPIRTAPQLRATPGASWEQAAPLWRRVETRTGNPPRYYHNAGSAWEEAARLWWRVQSVYQYPPQLHRFHREAFEEATTWNHEWGANFGQGETLNLDHLARFENAGLPGPGRSYPPTDPVEPEPPEYQPDLTLVFCGPVLGVPHILVFGRDPCWAPPQPGNIIIPTRRIYTVSNSASIVRVSDGRDIPAASVALSINADAYTWEMNANVTGKQALALVEGTDGQPVEVDVQINGTTWRVLVDGWGLQEAWARSGGTIYGRSRAAYLAAPYAPTSDHLESQDRLAQQLAAQELPPGWALTWGIDDWLVPAGAWQYQGLTPVDAIARIAEAGGGYLQADPVLEALHVRPRYPVAPWELSAATADLAIPRDLIVQRSSDKRPGQGVNAVFVHGGAQGGVLARVLRQGTAGDVMAPMIVDPLITATAPARARGIATIAASMRRATETHELPLSASLGGLVQPGTLLAVGSDSGGGFQTDWKGIVRGVTVTAGAERASNGGVRLKVRQQVEVERHFEEATP